MSSLKKLRALMSNVTNLYDRYINLTFVSKNGNMCSIITPRTGIKPNIAVQLKTEPSDMASQFTISIMNCTLDVNLSEFNYIKVEMGYYSSKEAFTFEGQILSVFQESPNPNGILSFQGEVGYTTAYVNSMPLSISLPEYPIAVESLINLVLNSINTAMQEAAGKANVAIMPELGRIPSEWTGQTLEFAGSTEQFPNAYSAVSWLNTVLLSYAYSKELPPVFTFLADDRMVVSSNVSSGKGPTLLSLSLVNSISAQGTHVLINCPFIPSIKADSCFYLTARNYTAVLNVNEITALDPVTLLKVYSSEIKFATSGTNQMRLSCIKLDKTKEGTLSSLNLLY